MRPLGSAIEAIRHGISHRLSAYSRGLKMVDVNDIRDAACLPSMLVFTPFKRIRGFESLIFSLSSQMNSMFPRVSPRGRGG